MLTCSLLLSACGGGGSGEKGVNAAPGDTSGQGASGTTREHDQLENSDHHSGAGQPGRVVIVSGSAVKGVILNGIVTFWRPEGQGAGSSWVQVGGDTRTDLDGRFAAAIPEEHAGKVIKVALSADNATAMRCDVRPFCRAPNGTNVDFGEWFRPGDGLTLTTIVQPASETKDAAVLTPLGSLAYAIASKNRRPDWSDYQLALRGLESKFGLAPGVLDQPQVDLASENTAKVSLSSLHAALVNAGFMALVEDSRWQTLEAVMGSFEANAVQSSGIPHLAGDNMGVSVELVLLAAREQTERHTASGSNASEAGRFNLVSERLEYSLKSLNAGGGGLPSSPVPAPAPQPVPDPEPDPIPDSSPEPAPEPEPGSKNPEPVSGAARLSWQAPLTRENGESMAMGEIDHYVIRYGIEQDVTQMSNEVIIENGQAMTHEISGLGAGTWFFSIKTIDVAGLASDWSGLVSKSITR